MSPHATPAALSLTGLLEGLRAALTPERAARDTSAGETCTFVRIPAITALGDAA